MNDQQQLTEESMTRCITCEKMISRTEPHDCYPTKTAKQVLEEQIKFTGCTKEQAEKVKKESGLYDE